MSGSSLKYKELEYSKSDILNQESTSFSNWCWNNYLTTGSRAGRGQRNT